MVKITVALTDDTHDAIAVAAATAGKSIEKWMADTADAAAFNAARQRFATALAANPAATSEYDAAVAFTLRQSRKALATATRRFGPDL